MGTTTIIVGDRQTGKTTKALSIAKSLGKEITWVSPYGSCREEEVKSYNSLSDINQEGITGTLVLDDINNFPTTIVNRLQKMVVDNLKLNIVIVTSTDDLSPIVNKYKILNTPGREFIFHKLSTPDHHPDIEL